MKHVIIGGVAGGATAAARIRRLDEYAEIILLEKGKYISYANCGLPYYIGGVIEDRDDLFLQTPASFGKRFNIDVRVENTVIAINTTEKTVTVRRKDRSKYTETYDRLLLSPGAAPVKPPLAGIDLEGIFTLRDVAETDRIKNYLHSRTVKKAVVVGGGFIGLEMAENLHHAGAEVSIVEMADQVMTPLDFSMAAHVHHHLLQKGVKLYLEQTVERFEQNYKASQNPFSLHIDLFEPKEKPNAGAKAATVTDKPVESSGQKDELLAGAKATISITDKPAESSEPIKVCLKSGLKIPADIVILSIGIRPETWLTKAAGLKTGETGGIWVNEYLETSAKDVYAVGDAIEFPHPITGKPWLNFLANPANRQGRLVADNMVKGNTEKYEGAIGTAIAKVFDLAVATTGLPAKKLKQLNIPYQSSFTHSASHAGYYPESKPLSIKLTFDPETGRLYGAQSVGYDGVDKRIDQIALLIKSGGSVFDLMKVEHAYAPPFSSAKDPIAIAGYVAGNIVTQKMPVVHWREVQAANPDEVTILDVRTHHETAGGQIIPGSLNIPLDELRSRLNEIPASKPVYIYCGVGLRGYLASQILVQRGFQDVKNLSGGYKTFSIATTPV